MDGDIAFVDLNLGTVTMVPTGSHEADPRSEMASMICAAVEQGGVDYPYDPGYRILAERQSGFLVVTVERDQHPIFVFGTAATAEHADAGWARMNQLRTTRAMTTEMPEAPWSAACAIDLQAFLRTEWLGALQLSVASTWVVGYERMRVALDHHGRTGVPSQLAMQFEYSPPFGAVSKGLQALAKGKPRRHPEKTRRRAVGAPRSHVEPPGTAR